MLSTTALISLIRNVFLTKNAFITHGALRQDTRIAMQFQHGVRTDAILSFLSFSPPALRLGGGFAERQGGAKTPASLGGIISS